EVRADFVPFNPSRIPFEPERQRIVDATTPPVSSSHPNTEADSGLGRRFRAVRPGPFQAMVRIQFGCNNFCTYCIVPYVRGPEQCRSPWEIVEETRRLVDDGVLEVTLIGQTVNAYRYSDGPAETRLAGLLGELQKIEGLRRIRFLTNYPREMTSELIRAVRDHDKVCPYFHVPAQSGSDTTLRRMNRHYTLAQYREMLHRIREAIPDASITSDFIVGFCGETEEEFHATVDLVRESRFRNIFVFKYSPRPGAKAAELMVDDVPDEVKRRRNRELLAIQTEISSEDQRVFVGREVEILVEGVSKGNRHPKNDGPGAVVQLVGRTVYDQIVVFDGPRSLAGRILTVRIVRAEPFTLFGEWSPNAEEEMRG
ncbi:MAG: MiaB/RimO family radical SAM methylthiotransferase, partial [Planctomycetia bacterium]|nr:MiaB/RimO family radical SAM methylthiotransferase [Planctomycetia bacterium]